VSAVKDIVEQSLNKTPPYEDTGIAYKGKYKIQKGQDTYETKNQYTKYYGWDFGTSGSGGYIRVGDQKVKFFATGISISWSLNSSCQFAVSDGSTTRIVQELQRNVSAAGSNTTGTNFYQLDFKDFPRMFFDTTINFDTSRALVANEKLFVIMHGFYEE